MHTLTHTDTIMHDRPTPRRHSLLTVPKGLCDRLVQGAIAVRHRVLRREGERPAQVLGGDRIDGERHHLNELRTELCRQPGALRDGEEEGVERLPGIRMAGHAEDVLVRREHLQNGETNTNGQRLHGRGYSIGCSYGYVMLQNGRTPYVQSIEKLSPRDHRP